MRADLNAPVGGANPRISIGLPVFNGERYLELSLSAILSQSYPEFELVIVDNASTDRTETICRGVADRDGRVRYHRNAQNLGAAANFNRAFTLTASEYFKWVACDDLCEPTFLERCIEALDAAPEAVLAYPKTRLIDEDGTPVRAHEDHLALGEATAHERLRHLVRALGYANPLYGLIRAHALRQTRLHGTLPSSDQVLLAELSLLGPWVEIPDRLFLRRIHRAQSSQANRSAAAPAASQNRQARPGFRGEAWRLFAELAMGILRAPLPARERLRCMLTFALVGGRRYGHPLAGELKQLALFAGATAQSKARIVISRARSRAM